LCPTITRWIAIGNSLINKKIKSIQCERMAHVSDYFSETIGYSTINTSNSRGFAHDSETMRAAFSKNLDRFKQHRETVYRLPPLDKYPHYVQETINRIERLFCSGVGWHTKSYSTKLWDRFRYHDDKHNKDGRRRKVRDQFLLSMERVIRCLVFKCNIQPNHRLTNLEVNDLALVDIAHWTGLSLTTVNDCIDKLKLLGLYRSQPIKIKKRDESGAIYYRESKSKKWLTWKLFDLLGMKKKIKKNLSSRVEQSKSHRGQAKTPSQFNKPRKSHTEKTASNSLNEIRGLLGSADPP